MIISLSDVHFGYKYCEHEAFQEFTNYIQKKLKSNDHLVLLGDILDFWRSKNVESILQNMKAWKQIFELIKKGTNVHYVIGNHDYYLSKIIKRFPEYYAFDLRKNLRLEETGISYFFIHGYELDALMNYEPLTLEEYEKISENLCRAGNILGSLLNGLWGIRKKMLKPPQKRTSWKNFPSRINHMLEIEKFACSKAKNLFLGMRNDEKLVFGHTHRPFINNDTANTGCWVKDAKKYNTYLVIENGEWYIETWKH